MVNVDLSMKVKFILWFFAVACFNGLMAQQPRLVLPVGHPQGILQVASTPDGKYIFSRSFNDFNARIWSAVSGNLVSETTTPERVSYFVVGNDNAHILLVSEKSGIYWNYSTNRPEITIHDSIEGAVFSEKGDRLLYYKGMTVKMVNLKDSSALFEKKMMDTVTDVRFLNNDEILAVCRKENKLLFRFFNTEKQQFIREFKIKDIKLAECRFDEDAASYKIFTNAGTQIVIYTLSKNNYEVLDSQVYKSFGFSEGINDYSPETGCYLVGYPKNNKIIIMYPKEHLMFYQDDKSFTTGLTRMKFINNGKNICVQLLSNYNLDIYNDSLIYLQSFYSQDTANAKNVLADISYNKSTNRFLAVLDDNMIREFQCIADTCKLINVYQGKTKNIQDVFNIGDTLYVADGDGFMKAISLRTGLVLSSIQRSPFAITSLKYNRRRAYGGFVSYSNHTGVMNMRNHKLVWDASLKNIKNVDEYFSYPYCDISDKYVLTRVGGFNFSDRKKVSYRMELRDIETGKIIYSKKLQGKQRGFPRFNTDGDEIIDAVSADSAVYFTDLNFHQIRKFTNMGWVVSVQQSQSKKYLVTMDSKGCALYDYKTGATVYRFAFNNDNDFGHALSHDDSMLIVNSGNGKISVCDVFSKKVIGNYHVHKGSIVHVYFVDNRKFVTYSEDGYLKYWQLDHGALKEIFAMVPFDGKDYATILPTGNYQCTPNAAKLLHYVTEDLKVITFEQLDLKYNRPDLVLRAIGNADTNLINSYYKAWQKRIKKLGIDTTQFRDDYSVPEADFANRDSIAYEQTEGRLKLHIKGADSTYALDRLNVWVNEVPLFGERGISLRRRNSHFLDTTLTITLSDLENRIETSVYNVNGTESYRMPLHVKYTPQQSARQKVYFIGMGMDRFANASYNLNYSAKDIRDLASGLKKQYGDMLETDTLFNEKVTPENIRSLKKKLLKSGVNDRVIVAYSGHGLLSSNYDYYLSTYTVNFDKPEENGLPYEALEDLLDSIPARQKLMLIDACHSGEVDKEEQMYITRVADSLGLSRGARVVGDADTSKPHLGLNNSFELMQHAFVNVGKGTGATVISASAGTQFALERGDLKNGVFTFCILEAMNANKNMTVTALKDQVGRRVTELTGGLQKPSSRGETVYHDWRVW